jgi:hypothetical protein
MLWFGFPITLPNFCKRHVAYWQTSNFYFITFIKAFPFTWLLGTICFWGGIFSQNHGQGNSKSLNNLNNWLRASPRQLSCRMHVQSFHLWNFFWWIYFFFFNSTWSKLCVINPQIRWAYYSRERARLEVNDPLLLLRLGIFQFEHWNTYGSGILWVLGKRRQLVFSWVKESEMTGAWSFRVVQWASSKGKWSVELQNDEHQK